MRVQSAGMQPPHTPPLGCKAAGGAEGRGAPHGLVCEATTALSGLPAAPPAHIVLEAAWLSQLPVLLHGRAPRPA
jgi:hypothetical protein